MLANLSKRLDNHPDWSEGLFHFTHTELLQDLNSTFPIPASKGEAGGRRDSGGKGKNNSKTLGQSHPFFKE